MKNATLSRLLISFAAALANSAFGANATSPSYVLDVDESSGQLYTLNLPDDGSVVVTLIQSSPATNVTLHLLPFRNEANAPVRAQLVEPADGTPLDHTAKAIVARIALPADLPAGTYRGGLLLTGDGMESKVWRLGLVRPREAPAALVAAEQSVTIDYSRGLRWILWGPENTGQYTVELREKGGTKAISGITYRHEQAPTAPSGLFDPKSRLNVAIVPGIKPYTSNAVITARGLDPGEYIYYLRFSAPDVAADDAQKVTVKVRVKRSLAFALGPLALGLGISFFATKYISYLRARAKLLQQLESLERCWGTGLHSAIPSARSVAWVRSLIEQARAQTRRFSFIVIDALKGRVSAAERIVTTLDSIADLLQQVDALPRLRAYRAREDVEELLTRIDPRTFDDAAAARCKAEVEKLRDWLDDDKGRDRHWNKVRTTCLALVAEIEAAQLVDAGLTELKALVPPKEQLPDKPDSEYVRRFDENYCRLEILWKHRHWPDAFKALSSLALTHPSMSDFFDFTDHLDWGLLKDAAEKGRVQIDTTILGGSGALEAFQPVLFEFIAHDSVLNGLYVVKHGCEYHWKLWRTPVKKWIHPFWWQTPSKSETSAPMLVDYPQGSGVLHVELQIKRKGEIASTFSLEVGEVQKSDEFQAIVAMDQAEILSFSLSVILALVSGLATYYVAKPTFGSVQDLVSLFFLAAGVDQSRNALQMIQSWKVGGAEAMPTGTQVVAAAH